MSITPGAPASIVIRQREVPTLAHAVHDNAVLHRVLAARGIRHRQDASVSLADIPRPDKLPSIKSAVARLLQARGANERILVVGDYDCDGATSTAVAMLGLQMLGFKQLDFVIPSRFEYGYGLSPAIVDLAHQKHRAQLIVTVDNGVASVDGVAHAASLGMDVVVTDHHLAPDLLPDAVAIVNPNLPDAVFEGRNLAGVGVIFYTLLAVRAQLKTQNDPHAGADLLQLLDLVAIGTVADVVPLDSLNRKLVEQGLRRIRAGKTRYGVLALLKAAGREPATACTQDIGFGIGPRLNAAGRIGEMRLGVQCLMSETMETAQSLAAQLQALNVRRQGIEADMRSGAQEQLNALALQSVDSDDSFGICLKDERWHQGVIGILAGRIKDNAYKPVVVFTADGEHDLKGSARSIPDVHIRDVLQNIVARHPGMISKFGGHAMAAGLTLSKQAFEPFAMAFNDAVRQVLQGQHKVREYLTDGALDESELTLENATLLNRCMPWGQGFSAPLFHNEFTVVSQKSVGRGHLKMQLALAGSSRAIDAIAFNQKPLVAEGQSLLAVYSPDANHFRQTTTLQLRVEHLESLALR